jgi:hypothetical protein
MTPNNDDRLVGRFMSTLYSEPVPNLQTAPSGEIWWRAKVMERAAARQRAIRAIEIVHAAAYFLIASACATVLYLSWPVLQQLPPEAICAALMAMLTIAAAIARALTTEQ